MKTKELNQILQGALTGTAVMTLYSYLQSRKEERQFTEPVLLNEFLSRSGIDVTKDSIAGYALHFGVGAMFVTAYHQHWKRQKKKPSLLSGLALGAFSGLAGIAVWKTLYRLHPNPPPTQEAKYYKQLFVAHLFFGAFAALGYRHDRDLGNKDF